MREKWANLTESVDPSDQQWHRYNPEWVNSGPKDTIIQEARYKGYQLCLFQATRFRVE